MVGRLPHLSSRAYRVTWRTLSCDDLHKGSGRFAFGVRRPVEALGGLLAHTVLLAVAARSAPPIAP